MPRRPNKKAMEGNSTGSMDLMWIAEQQSEEFFEEEESPSPRKVSIVAKIHCSFSL